MTWLTEEALSLIGLFATILAYGALAAAIATGAVFTVCEKVLLGPSAPHRRLMLRRRRRREADIARRLGTLLALSPMDDVLEAHLRELKGPLKVWINPGEGGRASIMAQPMDEREQMVAIASFDAGSGVAEILNAMAVEIESVAIEDVPNPDRPASATLAAASRALAKPRIDDLARGYGRALAERAVGA